MFYKLRNEVMTKTSLLSQNI